MTGDLLTGLWTRTTPPDWPASGWERLFSQARRARLMGRVALQVQARGWSGQVPAQALPHLDNALRMAARQQQIVRWEVDCIRRAIGHLPTPIVLLKGAAYVMAGLPAARGRRFGDIDILVAADALPAVEAALAAQGWAPLPMAPDDDRYYRDRTHELPPMKHADRPTVLDVHHAITQPGSDYACDPRPLLEAAQPLPDQPRLQVLCPEDMVLHAAVHLMQEGDFARGLRDLLDLDDLIRCFAGRPDFWPRLLTRAGLLRLDAPLLDVLTPLRRTLGLDVPQASWQALRQRAARPWRQPWMDAMLRVALRPDHPDADGPATRLVRGCLYVRAHWMRMPLHRSIPHLARKAWLRLRPPAAP